MQTMGRYGKHCADVDDTNVSTGGSFHQDVAIVKIGESRQPITVQTISLTFIGYYK